MIDRKVSIKRNAILNTLKTIVGLLSPLIIFPYTSRVLGVDGIGQFNFSNSVVSYFILIANLGVFTYAIREGAQYRGCKEEINKFASEVFTINLLSTIVSYILLGLSFLLVPHLRSYQIIIIILSADMFFSTLGTQWIYNIYEDFTFITIRTIGFQGLSIALTFLLVNDPSDVWLYAAKTVIVNIVSNIFNYIYAKKYVRINIVFNKRIFKHFKPILLIFSTTIAINIYVSADSTMLGFMTDDYNVGLYSISVKLYTIIKNLILAVLTVLVPRFAILSRTDKASYTNFFTKTYKTLIVILLPLCTGLACLSKEIIMLVAGNQYIDSSVSLKILSLTCAIALVAYLFVHCNLIPLKREDIVLKATIFSAVVNILLNFVMIPKLSIAGAAISTVVAEGIVLLISYKYGREMINIKLVDRDFLITVFGCVLIAITSIVVHYMVESWLIVLLITITISVIIYFAAMFILRHSIMVEIINQLRRKKLI